MKALVTLVALTTLGPCLVAAQGSIVSRDLGDQRPRIHWVQVASFPDDARAEALAREVEEAGFSPVCIYRAGPNRTVRVGEFTTMMDAQLALNDLQDTGYQELRIRFNSLEEERAASREWAFQPYVCRERPNELFHTVDRPLATLGCHFSNEACAIDEGGHRTDDRLLMRAVQEQIDAESNALNDSALSDSDPARGQAYFQLADLAARRGDLDLARELALPVADGRYAASAQTRWDAMWLMARVYHAKDWRQTAYRAYREIEAICTDPADLARCLYEQAGLLYELSRSEIGRTSEARARCQELLQRCPEAGEEVHELRAKALLLSAETLYREGDNEGCLAGLDSLVQTHGDCPLQVGVALLFRGYALSAMGRLDSRNFDLADQCYADLEQHVLTYDDLFRSGVVQRRAAIARAFNANAARDETAMRVFAEHVIEQWPESLEARDAQQLIDTPAQIMALQQEARAVEP